MAVDPFTSKIEKMISQCLDGLDFSEAEEGDWIGRMSREIDVTKIYKEFFRIYPDSDEHEVRARSMESILEDVVEFHIKNITSMALDALARGKGFKETVYDPTFDLFYHTIRDHVYFVFGARVSSLSIFLNVEVVKVKEGSELPPLGILRKVFS